MKTQLLAALVCLPMITPAFAGDPNVANSDNVRAILQAQSDRWVSIKNDAGVDYVSFFPLVGWRCELRSVYYGLNGQPADSHFEMEPCGSTVEQSTLDLHITRTAGTVQSIKVRLTYKDGQTSSAEMQRSDIIVN